MFEKFPSIEQYRHVVKEITDQCQLVGKDADGNAIFARTRPLPIISFVQTVKIHGTNGGVILFKDGTIRTQSRNRLLSPESDNNGFNKWIAERGEYWQSVATYLFKKYANTATKIIIYGEFAGQSIQKNVAITQTPKAFYVFYGKVVFVDGSHIDLCVADFELFQAARQNIYSIYQFPCQIVSIDLNRADDYVPMLQEQALKVEAHCPVGAFHGVDGVGEGIVLSAYYKDKLYRFKVKGDKHSASKVRLSATVDDASLKDVREFVEQVVTGNRLQQGIDYMNEMDIATDIKHTGDFIKWVVNDVHKEESDLIEAKGFDKKLVNQAVAKIAKAYYFEKLA